MWNIVAGSAHASGQIKAGEIIYKVTDPSMSSSTSVGFYELKAGRIVGVSKPVFAYRDSRNSNGFILGSAENFNNFKPDDQIEGSALFANISELSGKGMGDFLADATPLNLYMDANVKLVATASASGSLIIPIPSGGTIVITVQPQYGTVSLVSGTLQYAASNGYSGADSFTYEVHGASGDLISSGGVCSFSTSASTATAIPVFAKAVIDVVGDIRVNCVVGAAVTLYKNTDSTILSTINDSANLGYVVFQNVARVQTDIFKTKAQKSGLTLSGFSIITTVKRKPSAISGVTKMVQANGTVSITIAELVADSENAVFF